MDSVEVDGSYGEGGGQILRTAAVFSAIQRRPIHVTRIRAGRETPGLKRQHITTLRALAEVFGAELTGAEEGSSEIRFAPGRPRTSSVTLDVRTAGSITLLLQAVVPAAALAGSELSLDLTGGTDVPWSPTFDYLALVVRSAYEATGISFEVEAAKRGYFPKGGGRVKAHVRPSASVRNIILGPVSNAASVDLVSRCGMLPRSVAERQLASMERVFEASGTGVKTRTVSVEQADSPGTSALAWTSGGGRCLGGDAIGARGKPAEAVGAEAANRTLAALQTAAPVDENLADMILPLLSLADGPSSVAVPSFTEHLKTSLHVAALFTGCRFRLVDGAGVRTVEVAPSPRHNA